jgi:phage tail-like protein
MGKVAEGAQRFDPYKNFRFRLWDGNRMYFGSKVIGLLPEVVEHRAGDDPSTSSKSPGRSKYDAVTLDRGVTQDLAFSDWASQVWNYGSALGAETSSANYRKNIYLEFYDEAGSSVVTYKIYSPWISEFRTMPPGGIFVHFIHPRGARSIPEQLATIFEGSLTRLRP